MRKLLAKHRPSPALGIACLALFVALGGTSSALPGRNTVDRNDLRASVVASKNIRKGAVSFSKIRNAAVRRRHIKEFAVGGRQLANAAVVTRKIRDGNVTGSKLAQGSVTAGKVGPTIFRTGTSAPTTDADGTTNGGSVGVATATAQCSAGEKMLTGGARWSVGANAPTTRPLFLRESHPTGNGWRAVGNVDFGAQGNATLQAFVVCLR